MTYFRATITKTLTTQFNFDESEMEDADDEFIAAWEISQNLDYNDWEIDDEEVDVVEVEGEL